MTAIYKGQLYHPSLERERERERIGRRFSTNFSHVLRILLHCLTLPMFLAPTFSQRSPRIALYGSFTEAGC